MKFLRHYLPLFMTVAISISNISLAAATPIEDAVANPERSDADRMRDKTSKPVAILTFFDVRPGMAVLDLFSGGGYYSEILSYAVGPNGRVAAHNNQAYEGFQADTIKARYAEDRLPNVEQLSSEADDLKLPAGAFDMILMVLSYHDIYYTSDEYGWPAIDRDHFFSQISAALKPGGTLAIVDHAALAGTGKDAAQELHRIDEEFARRDIESAGFVFEASSDVLRNPEDSRTLGVFDDAIRRHTDRFVYRFRKPE